MGARLANQKEKRCAMTESCYSCKGKVVQQPTTVDFWWGDDLKIIENAPVGVCAQCGEKYFDSPHRRYARRFNRIVEDFVIPEK